jgi:hypothetical protein
MTDDASPEKPAAITRLLERHAEARTRLVALTVELEDVGGRLGEIRQALGNPFYYSGTRHGREENAAKSIAKFTGYASHEIPRRLIEEMKATTAELRALRGQLREAGVEVE